MKIKQEPADSNLRLVHYFFMKINLHYIEYHQKNLIYRKSANDAEDGNTVFLKNVAFSVTNDDLQEFAKQFGEIVYGLVCVDKLTEHSKGSAFIRFKVHS